MKTAFRFCLPLGLALVSGAYAQWDMTNVGTFNSLSSVVFSDSLHGYTAGTSGLIFGTVNGGTAWTPQTSGTGLDLHGMAFTAQNTGIIVGDSARVLRTTDGGTTWTKATVNSPGSFPAFRAVAFGSKSMGWIAGDGGAVYRSLDSGRTWNAQTSGTTADLEGLFFKDSLGWAVGDRGTVLKTLNGTAWTKQTLDSTARLNSVYFATAGVGYAAGSRNDSAAIWKTIDGGATWTRQTVAAPLPLYSIRFTDAIHGYAAGGSGTLLLTSNGGATWTVQNPSVFADGTSYDFTSVYFLSPTLGFIADAWGDIYVTTTAGVVSLRSARPAPAVDAALSGGRLTYSLPAAASVNVALYDAAGVLRRSLFHGSQGAGPHALDLSAAKLEAGHYWVRIDAAGLHRSLAFVK